MRLNLGASSGGLTTSGFDIILMVVMAVAVEEEVSR